MNEQHTVMPLFGYGNDGGRKVMEIHGKQPDERNNSKEIEENTHISKLSRAARTILCYADS